MLISVVTVVLNRKHVIEHAIESLRKQTFDNYEHVIQDGGSRDGTLELLKQLSDSRTRLESARDNGIYDAINRGIARCQGEVIGLLHSDDQLANADVLERVADVMKDPSIDGVYGDLLYVSSDDPERTIRYWKAGSNHRQKLRWGWMPPHPTLYLRSSVFRRYGMYDDSFRISGDYEAMVRWLYRDQIRLEYIPKVLVKMRVGGASNGSLKQLLRKSQEDLQVIRRYQVGGVGTLLTKNLRKLNQFIARP